MTGRFPIAPDWRFVVTDLGGITQTFLDGLASQRQCVYTLNESAQFRCDVPADNPEVNIPSADGAPFVTYNSRLIYGFRRENPDGGPPWVVRFAGVAHQVNDELGASGDTPLTHISAFDPWTYLKGRPVVKDDGTLPGNKGLTITGRGPDVAKELLLNVIAAASVGAPFAAQNCFIDCGQTAFYAGTIETSMPEATFTFRQGMSVGDAWKLIASTGNCDLVLAPIYDPVNRPGFLCEFNGYLLAGEVRNDAVFALDMPSRNVNGINRLQDGAEMVNVGQGYLGAGGEPRPITPGVQTNVASIAKYGDYMLQEMFADLSLDTGGPLVDLIMQAKVQLAAQGRTSITVDLAPEFAPNPFLEYGLGDQVPLWASRVLRDPIGPTLSGGQWVGLHRIYTIPVAIPDDAPEVITALLMSPPVAV